MNTSSAFMQVSHIAKRYRTPSTGWKTLYTDVLSDVNFFIYGGEVVGLIGLSGKGKSTLARILLGIEKPDAGSIQVEGEPLSAWRKAHPGGMSVVFQNYSGSVNPNWTVQNLILEPVSHRLGQDKERFMQRVNELIVSVGLDASFLQRYPFELSGGQLQRVCIARALISEPRFIVFDEAVSSLDVSVQAEILNLLKTLRNEKTSWLFISHDIQAITSVCSRVLFLDHGKIVEDLPIEQLAKAEHTFVKKLLKAVNSTKLTK